MTLARKPVSEWTEEDKARFLARDLEDARIHEDFLVYKISQRKALSETAIKELRERMKEVKERQGDIRSGPRYSPHPAKHVTPGEVYRYEREADSLEPTLNSLHRMIEDQKSADFKGNRQT